MRVRPLPVIIFFIYLYLEISIFVAVANSIGVLLALIAIIATSFIGLSLVKSNGLKNIAIMQQKIANDENPKGEVIKSFSLLLAGFLLLIPGFLTDILGALLLLSPVQNIIVRHVAPKMKFKSRRYQSTQKSHDKMDIIEGKFEHKKDE